MMTETEIKQAFAETPIPTFADPDRSDVLVDKVDGLHYRVLQGRDRQAGPFVVGTTAVQYLDGLIDDGRHGDAPKVWIGDTGFSTDHARELAIALTAAADELDGLTGWYSDAH